MLVKFKNDTQDFEDKVEHLKGVLGVGSASKVADFAVSNYADLDKRYHAALDKIDRLMNHIDSFRSAAAAKQQAEQDIQDLLNTRVR